ncbi:ABC transporter ATP-binding protein [Lacticaseibacillus camelliae]|uniref:ABC-type aliphatic sulfonate transport system, ATP-binding component n=1 Tax=Lacticaseibacillus camelliae DSM 22697 = JCM 13995 TaxID=1423730 RepID=A0A0R2F3X5_9LACO|nr:ATP-binding cassette domain-containing protein [Lacticaseibacillus camelliae]KRN22974.1 ABC-type aliphatic sulfonate transport system, ATP-binding component [Lacticaseibacillus camelliae DSM 22697 = JCM 13995]
MTKPVVKLSHIYKQYGDNHALRDVSFDLQPGEFVALVGMSGGGKSTLLRLIAQLELPTAGTIEYADENLVTRVMFQDGRLLPWMTTLNNVSFASHDAKVQARAQKTLAAVGLAGFEQTYPTELSGGQKQRLALARALMADPELLLLDEPLGALDALTRRNMQSFITKICDDSHLTTLLITHDVDEAARMANRVIVVKNGRAVYETAGAKGQTPETVARVADQVLKVILAPDEEAKEGERLG